MHVRVCPECESEYLPRVERCSDCDVALVDRMLAEDDEEESEGEAGAHDDIPVPRLPPGEYVPLARRERAIELDPLAERLGKGRIPFRVDVRQAMSFELRVRREELAAAAALVADLLTASDQAADADGTAYEACPACAAELEPGARACPECGLELVFDAPRCERCEREIDPDQGRCLHCEKNPASD